jgi:hypothetical protein
MFAEGVEGQVYLARAHAVAEGVADGLAEENGTAGASSDRSVLPMEIRTLDAATPVAAVSVGQWEGRSFAVAGCEDGTIRVWDLAVGESSERRISGHSGPVWGVAFGLVNGQPIAVSAGDDQTIRLWDLSTGAAAGSPMTGHTAPVNAVALATLADRSVVVSASDDQTIRRWQLPDASMIGAPLDARTDWVNALAVATAPDGSTVIVSGSSDETVRVWDLRTGQVLHTLTGHAGSVSSVATAHLPDGRLIAISGSTDETVRLWELDTGENLRTFTGHSGRVRAVALVVTNDGRPFAVSGGNDRTIRVWDLVDDQAQPRILHGHDGPVRAVTIAEADGRNLLVSSSDDGTVRIWALSGQRPLTDQVEWISDAPAQVDLLRRRPLAQVLATRLRRMHAEEPGTSFLIHIDGPWGSGKSTLLNFLRIELQQEWAAIEFNSWRQASIGPPWWALLAALRHDIQRDLSPLARLRLRLAESWVRLRRVGAPFIVSTSIMLAVTLVAFLLLRPSGLTLKNAGNLATTVTAVVAAVGTVWAGALAARKFFLWDSARGARLFEQSDANPMEGVSSHFGWLVARARRPVVFFIDDLDRCPQEYVIKLLDAIQTLVRDAPGYITGKQRSDALSACFVIAADGAWIRKSYEIAYSQFADSVAAPGRPLGYLFLDKLFQLRVPVPSIDVARQEDYLRELLRVRSPAELSKLVNAEELSVRRELRQSTSEGEVIETLRGASPEVRSRVAGAAVEQLATPAVSAATEHSLQRFSPLLMPNPRSMKRFVNLYCTLRDVRIMEGNLVPHDSLALWTILEASWPGLADYLRTTPEAINLLGKRAGELEIVPSELRPLFADVMVNRLVNFSHGGPLEPSVISACCGADQSLISLSGKLLGSDHATITDEPPAKEAEAESNNTP